MKLGKALGHVIAAVAVVGMLVPNWARAEGPTRPEQEAATVLDVALQDGVFVGQILNAEGAPIRDEVVSVRKDGREVARTQTNETGRYVIHGLSTGVYQVVTSQGGAAYRVWSDNAAPPAAQPGALMIIGQPVRGQLGGGGLLANPWVLGGIAAAAIIVPLALDDDDPAS